MHTRRSIACIARQCKRALPALAETTSLHRRGLHLLVARCTLSGSPTGDHNVRELVPTPMNESTTNIRLPWAVVVAATCAALHNDEESTTALCEPTKCESPAHSEDPTYFDDDYDAKQLIGSGSFGMVMQCVCKKTGELAAVKMIQDLNDIRDEVQREKAALQSIRDGGGHINIVRYDGAYEHDGFHYIVTEFVDGESLYSFIQRHRHLSVKTALQFTSQLASALAFLKTRNLIHRDLKPANIMVTASDDPVGSLKVIDFGSAAVYDESARQDPSNQEFALSGTRCYWPPEMLTRLETSPAMDTWALGCILYIMIAGFHPFDMMGSSSEADIVHRAINDNVSFLHPVWADVPCNVKSLIRVLLEKDPHARLAIEDVLVHPAMQVITP